MLQRMPASHRGTSGPRRGVRRGTTYLPGPSGLAAIALLLVTGLAVPAQAHHRSDHKPSASQPVEKKSTAVVAYGTWHVDPHRNTVRGEVRVAEHGWLGLRTIVSTQRVTGLVVTVTATYGTSTEQRVTTIGPDQTFSVDFGDAGQPLTWTASTDGDDTHHGSQASGYFEPRYSTWPALPWVPSPVPCLSWDC